MLFVILTTVESNATTRNESIQVRETVTDVYHNINGQLTKVGEIFQGQSFIIEGEQTNWYLIKFGNRLGYVKKSSVDRIRDNSKVNHGNFIRNIELNTDATAYKIVSGKYTPIALIKKGTIFPSIDETLNWWKVDIGGNAAYIHKSAADRTFQKNDKYFTVVESTTPIYYNNSGQFEKVGELEGNRTFIRVEDRNNWHLIEFGGDLAYVKKSDTKPADALSTKKPGTNTIRNVLISDTTTVYYNLVGNYVSLGTIEKGTVYPIVIEQKNWVGINFSGRLAFISKQNVIYESYTETSYDIAYDRMLDIQMSAGPKSDGTGNNFATRSEVDYYLNPNNFNKGTPSYYQFLLLDQSASVTANQLNIFLDGKGTLHGQGQAFIEAGSIYNINEIYLVAHTLHETGNGTSTLASGVSRWTKVKPGTCQPELDKNGNEIIMDISPRKVFNMYGAGAYDNCPVDAGAQYAYERGWFTPSSAIKGGVSGLIIDYINRGQNTLYKMRWNPEFASTNDRFGPQYATHIAWADIQATYINNMYGMLDSYILQFDIPKYIGQPDKTDPVENVRVFPDGSIARTKVNLNLRTNPNTDNTPLETITAGTQLEILKQHENGWYFVRVPAYDNLEGWVSNDTEYVELLNVYRVNVNSLNVRESYSTDSNIIGSLKNNDLVAVRLSQYNVPVARGGSGYVWYQINFNSNLAWVAKDHLTKVQ